MRHIPVMILLCGFLMGMSLCPELVGKMVESRYQEKRDKFIVENGRPPTPEEGGVLHREAEIEVKTEVQKSDSDILNKGTQVVGHALSGNWIAAILLGLGVITAGAGAYSKYRKGANT